MNTPKKPFEKAPKFLLRATLGVVLAFWVFFEEVVWDAVVAGVSKCKTWSWIVGLKMALEKVSSPYLALGCFAVPVLAMLPINVCGGWLVKNGHYAAGLMVLIAMKLVGTVIFAGLFDVLKPVLMKWSWFESGFEKCMRWKNKMITMAKETWAYRWTVDVKRQVKERWKGWKANQKAGMISRWIAKKRKDLSARKEGLTSIQENHQA
jgi:hypothetical protein